MGEQAPEHRDRFAEVEKRVSDPEVASDPQAFAALMGASTVEAHGREGAPARRVFGQLGRGHFLKDSEDADMRELGAAELPALTSELEQGVEEAKWMLLPHDAADDRDAI